MRNDGGRAPWAASSGLPDGSSNVPFA
jgi:hypothetical protein